MNLQLVNLNNQVDISNDANLPSLPIQNARYASDDNAKFRDRGRK